jgi:hypothetical protein
MLGIFLPVDPLGVGGLFQNMPMSEDRVSNYMQLERSYIDLPIRQALLILHDPEVVNLGVVDKPLR